MPGSTLWMAYLICVPTIRAARSKPSCLHCFFLPQLDQCSIFKNPINLRIDIQLRSKKMFVECHSALSQINIYLLSSHIAKWGWFKRRKLIWHFHVAMMNQYSIHFFLSFQLSVQEVWLSFIPILVSAGVCHPGESSSPVQWPPHPHACVIHRRLLPHPCGGPHHAHVHLLRQGEKLKREREGGR